jgi:glutamyl-tRNA reductase
MSALAIEALRSRGVGDLLVLGRRPERAERVAARAGARHGSLGDLAGALAAADLVVSSTTASAVVVRGDVVAARASEERPLFVLDLAVPRDVDPAVSAMPGVRLCDIDDLRTAVGRLREGAAAEVARAEGILREETRRYAARRREARLAPLIEALHSRGEEVRAAELRKMAARLSSLPDRDREAIEALTRRIVRRLLHDPVVRLKDLTGRGLEDPHAQALADLFGLDVPDD